MKCWNDFTKEETECPQSPTLEQLRQPTKYRVVSDAQLKRDLRGRTISDIYRENAAGRRFDKCERNVGVAAEQAYAAWCSERKHKPHPASIDPDHPIAMQRLGLRYVRKV